MLCCESLQRRSCAQKQLRPDIRVAVGEGLKDAVQSRIDQLVAASLDYAAKSSFEIARVLESQGR